MARDPLQTVRKLLALSRSEHVHEAAAAAARAQELIARYRLEELIEAEASAAEPVEEEVLEAARRPRRWRSVLAAGLAAVNECVFFTRARGRGTELVLLGRAADRDAVRAMWDWLAPQLEWLSATHGGARDKRWHDDFRIGAAETILARLREVQGEQRDKLEATALVRIEPALVARRDALARATEALALRPGRGIRVDREAFGLGRRAAHTLHLGDEGER